MFFCAMVLVREGGLMRRRPVLQGVRSPLWLSVELFERGGGERARCGDGDVVEGRQWRKKGALDADCG